MPGAGPLENARQGRKREGGAGVNRQEYLLINMSPRKKGTSASFLRTLLRLALEKGSAAEIIHAIDYFDGRADIADLASVIARCDTRCFPRRYRRRPALSGHMFFWKSSMTVFRTR